MQGEVWGGGVDGGESVFERQLAMENSRYELLSKSDTEQLTEEEAAEGWHFCVEQDGALSNGLIRDGLFPFCRCLVDQWTERQRAAFEMQHQTITLKVNRRKIVLDRKMALTIVSALTDAIADGFDTEIEVEEEELPW